MIPRRRFLSGLGAILAAPAIVRVAALMPVKAMPRGFWNDQSVTQYLIKEHDGKVSELIAYSRALTPTEHATMLRYYEDRFSLQPWTNWQPA